MTLYDILIMPPFLLFARTFDKVMWPAQINVSIRLWPWPTPKDICTSDLCTAWLPYKHDPLPHSLSITNLHVYMTGSIEADHFWLINTHHLIQNATNQHTWPAQVWSICTYMWPAQNLHKCNQCAHRSAQGVIALDIFQTGVTSERWRKRFTETGQSLQPVNYVSLIQSHMTRVQWGCSNVENSASRHCEVLRAHLEIRRSTRLHTNKHI